MRKKLFSFIIFIGMVFACSLLAAATGDKTQNIRSGVLSLMSKQADPTSDFLVTLTSPESVNVNTFRKNFKIGGTSSRSEIVVVLGKLNESTGEYELFETLEGDVSWEIGKSGFFAKEIALEKGQNRFKLIAYIKDDTSKLEPGKNVQISYFTITQLEETLRDRILNSVLDLSNVITKFISGKN